MDKPPLMLEKEVTYEVSRALQRKAMRRYSSRRLNKINWVIALSTTIGAYLLLAAMLGAKTVTTVRVCSLLSLIFLSQFLGFLSMFCFNKLKSPSDIPTMRVKLTIQMDTITFDMGESVSVYRWSCIKCLWKFPDVILHFFHTKSRVPVALPVQELGPEVIQVVEQKVREHGGDVA